MFYQIENNINPKFISSRNDRHYPGIRDLQLNEVCQIESEKRPAIGEEWFTYRLGRKFKVEQIEDGQWEVTRIK